MKRKTRRRKLKPLLSALELKTLSASPTFLQKYRVLEAGLGEGYRKHYEDGHITDNAIYIDTLKCTQPNALIPRGIPDVKCFQEYASNLGISNAHHLIIYDRSPYGFYASSRMWWTFRLFGHQKVSILNGGLSTWIRSGYKLSNKLPDLPKENFWVMKERKFLKRKFEHIQANIESRKETLLDVRSVKEFNSGHIPNSKNIPYPDFFDRTTGLLKTKEELAKMFKDKEIERPLIASCLTGMTATTAAFAAYLVGFKETSVYYGSWTEYSQRAK